MGYAPASATSDADEARLESSVAFEELASKDLEPAELNAIDPNDPDAVEALGDEIITWAGHLHAGKQFMLKLLACFDRARGWEPGGHRSCAEWLAFRGGYDLGTAREHVRVARALEELPKTSEAMGRGALSFSQVRALTRVVKADTEEDLVELAEGCTTAQLERLVRAWKKGSRQDEAAWERERHRSRTFSVFSGEDGMYAVRGELEPEVGAVLMRAVEAAGDALYRRRPDGLLVDAEGRPHDRHREAARRRADAIGLVAERALAAGFGADPEAAEDARSESEGTCTRATEAPISGSRAERYQVMLFVDPGTLEEDGEPGRSELPDGTRVSAETSRRLSCDAGLVRIEEARTGPRPESGPGSGNGRNGRHADGAHANRVLNVGRRTRTIPPALRRALEARDRGCRFPGCGLRFTEGHHLIHWADGGETSLANTALLCRYHHRLVHEGGWGVEWWEPGVPAFRDPRGSLHLPGRGRPLPKLPERILTAIKRQNRLRGADPGPLTASARWKREADIPDRVLFRALEAAL